MTQPEIWSRILRFHEIWILATACGMETFSDIAVRQTKQYLWEKQRFTHGQCLTGKGKKTGVVEVVKLDK